MVFKYSEEIINKLRVLLIRNKKDVLSILFLFSLTVLFFHKVFLSNAVLLPGEIVGQYLVWKDFVINSIHNFHQLPLWNPYEYSGTPYLASPPSALFYPPNLIYLLIDLHYAFEFILLLDVFLLGIFTYLFARITVKKIIPSLVASITMMFGGAIIVRINAGHMGILDSIVWFPAFIFFIELQIRTRNVKYALYNSVVLALLILAGHIQIAYYGLFAGGLYFVLRLIFEYIEDKKRIYIRKQILLFLLTCVLGFGIASIQLLPTLELSQFTARNIKNYEFASSFSMPIPQLSQLFYPHFFGYPGKFAWGRGNFWEFTAYSGVVSYLLVVISIFYKRNKYTICFMILGLFSLLFITGSYGPIYWLLYELVPGMSSFRIPPRFLFVFSFSVSILAAYGFNNLFELFQKKKEIKQIVFLLFFVSVFTMIFALIISFNSNLVNFLYQKFISKKYFIGDLSSFYQYFLLDCWVVAGFSSLLTGVIILTKNKFIKIKLSKLCIMGFIILDFFIFGLPLISLKKIQDIKNDSLPSLLKTDVKQYRVMDLSGSKNAWLEENNIETVLSYNPALLSHYREFVWQAGDYLNNPFEPFIVLYDIKNLNIARLLNVKYIISKNKILSSDLNQIDFKNVYVYELKDTLPKAYLVPDYKGKKNFQVPLKNSSQFESIKITKTPNTIHTNFITNKKGLLVFSEIWYPGWKAFVNDKQVEILKVNSIFRGLYINPGKNKIVLSYEPVSLKVGALISVVSITVFLFLSLNVSRKK